MRAALPRAPTVIPEDNGYLMDDITEAKKDFYSRVIQLYNRYDSINYGSKFHSALNKSLPTDNSKGAFFSFEDQLF